MTVDRRVALLLGVALLASGVLLAALTSQLTWRYDDWDVLLYRDDWSAGSLLDPQYEHIVLTRNVIYKVLLAAFGMDSQVPFGVVAVLGSGLVAVLLFAYLRRRVGDWLALILTVVILFFGAAWEDLLWPIQIVHYGSIACGLGMLLLLEREDRFGDRLACLLLAGSLSFFSLGIPFAAGAAVDVAQRRDVWRRRIYIVAIPSLLWGLWWFGWGHTANTSLSLRDIGTIPLFVFDTLAAAVASLLGLVANSESGTLARGGLDWGRPLLPIVLLAALWRLHQLERIPRWFWVVAAIGFSNWILGALGQQVGRPPEASRYQYPSAIFILLIAAELLRGVRLGPKTLVAISVIAAASLMGNLTLLFDSYDFRKDEGERLRAQLGAIEIARDTALPTFPLEADSSEAAPFSQTLPRRRFEPASNASVAAGPVGGRFTIDAGAYLRAVDDFGSPAYSPDEILDSAEPARNDADRMLAAALAIKLVPSETPASSDVGPRPSLIGPPEALEGSNANCLGLDTSGTSSPLLDLPPGGAAITSGPGGEFHIRLRRFASTILPVDLGVLPADASAVIDIPTDRSAQPWKLSLDGLGRVRVCGRADHGKPPDG